MDGKFLQAEEVVGPYIIVARLGAGGTAHVYRARKESGEEVALKVASKSQAARLKTEFTQMTRLVHRSIVKVHDYGEAPERGLVYYSMELVDGLPFFQAITEGLCDQREAMVLFSQLLFAVAWLHGRGVAHRDLKSQNVLVTRGGDVKIVDFGLAIGPELKVGTVKETTLQWVSPEQADYLLGNHSNRTRRLAESPATDCYALGVFLFRLLTGLWPHGEVGKTDAEQNDYLRRVSHGGPEESFQEEGLGAIASALLKRVDQGRPVKAARVLTAFEAAKEEMENPEAFSPLCAVKLRQIILEEQAVLAAAGAGNPSEPRQLVTPVETDAPPATAEAASTYRPPRRRLRRCAQAAVAAAALVLIGYAVGLGGARSTQATDCREDCVEPLAMDIDRGELNDLASVLPPQESLTDGVHVVTGMLLQAKLITGPEPDQKRYPCHHPERAWKGGCWNLMIMEGATREEKVANCKTTEAYEPEPGWCAKKGGFVYVPVRKKEDTRKPPVSVEKSK